LLGFWFSLAPAIAQAQAPEVNVSATTNRNTVDLSQSLTVTLTIEGPSPLRVELPRQVLAPETERDWKIQAVGQPILTRLDAIRERWEHVFRLDPFDYGQSMAVVFAPIIVNGREVPGAGFAVTVEDPRLEPRAADSMPVTGIEQLPPPIAPHRSRLWWWLAPLVLLVPTFVVAWRIWKSPKRLPPRDWALTALAALERDNLSGETLVTAVAAIVRGLIEREFGVPAPKLTTEELLTTSQQSAWPVEHTEPLRLLLEECDRAKFAGDVPDSDGCRDLLARGREWVELVCPSSQVE